MYWPSHCSRNKKILERIGPQHFSSVVSGASAMQLAK